MENFTFTGYKDTKLNCYLFIPNTEPIGVVQIIHGMQEHGLRYKHFAEFLTDAGFIVFVSDLRGHGHSAVSPLKQGYDTGDIFNNTIKDQKLICDYLDKTYNLPIYILGHSYGSFLTQKLVQVLSVPKKYVLVGTSNGDSIIYKMASSLSNLASLFGNKENKAYAVERLSFKAFAKKFENGNWLTRDKQIFDEYLQDEYCGKSFPYSFYKSMFNALKNLNSGIKNISKDKSILLVAGTKDPVGNYGKYVKSLHELYLKNGVNAKIKLYDEGRHEILNETNKAEVYNDILKFLKDN